MGEKKGNSASGSWPFCLSCTHLMPRAILLLLGKQKEGKGGNYSAVQTLRSNIVSLEMFS